MSTRKIVENNVPLSFIRRVGDWVQEGSNNTVIIMGTDRARTGGSAGPEHGIGHVSAEGGGKGTGTIHMIAGRKDRRGNPDFDNDLAFIYLTMKSRVDKNLNLESVERADNDVAAAIIKSDAIRIVARRDYNIKISLDDGSGYVYVDSNKISIQLGKSRVEVNDDKIVLTSGKIDLGKDANQQVILGNQFMSWLNTQLSLVPAHTHVSAAPGSPTGPGTFPVPISSMTDQLLSSQTSTK